MEAGTGIEPVFTDLQSHRLPEDIKGLDRPAYQDKPCTGREPDTSTGGTEKERPGALAGATGAEKSEQSFKSKDYRERAEAASILCRVISECHAEDAAPILYAVLDGYHRDGMPVCPRRNLMAYATEWASWANPVELKAYAIAAARRMDAGTREAFRLYLQGAGNG